MHVYALRSDVMCCDVCQLCVCDAHDWCPKFACGVYFYVASFGSHEYNNNNDNLNDSHENVVDFFTISIKSSGFASLFKFSWVRNVTTRRLAIYRPLYATLISLPSSSLSLSSSLLPFTSNFEVLIKGPASMWVNGNNTKTLDQKCYCLPRESWTRIALIIFFGLGHISWK